MEEKFGIDNLKKIIALPIELGNIADSIGAENSSNWKKWLKIIDIFDEVFDLFKVDFKAIKDEYLDLSESEKEEIKQMMKDKFKIHDEKLEFVIEKCFEMLFNLESIIKSAVQLFKDLK